MKVWILTSEVNAYDQHGCYFEAVYKSKPTREQLEKATGRIGTYIDHILSGGGRMKYEDEWYNLEEIVAQ